MNTISLSEVQLVELSMWKERFESDFGFTFLGPSYERVPFSSNKFKGRISNNISSLEFLLLSLQYIDMGTNDDDEIRYIRRELFPSDEVADAFNRYNKLTRGIISSTQYLVNNISENLIFGGIDIAKDFPSNYNYGLSFDEKRKYFETYDERIFQFLEKLQKL
jgi:hypothetical protein